MSDITDLFSELETLYAGLPDVPCTACGKCCVTPHMTAVEFAYLLKGMLESCDAETLGRLVNHPMEGSSEYAGNFLCGVQDDNGRCRLHAYRPLACRLEGIPVLDEMSMRDEPICPFIKPDDMAVDVTAEQVETWIQQAFDLSNAIHPVSMEPWFLNGLHLECWWAVLFDLDITQSFFLDIRAKFNDTFELHPLAELYQDQTGFAERIGLIESYFAEMEAKRPDKAFKLIRRIVHGFPKTGTYFHYEGQQYFRFTKDLVRGRQNARGN